MLRFGGLAIIGGVLINSSKVIKLADQSKETSVDNLNETIERFNKYN
ncbi:hypothetical protein WH390_01455 [Candidatus Arsenophonus nilaparvatae]|nr:hypothetical protein [Candidatus Arsenophonus nilaparvatae]